MGRVYPASFRIPGQAHHLPARVSANEPIAPAFQVQHRHIQPRQRASGITAQRRQCPCPQYGYGDMPKDSV